MKLLYELEHKFLPMFVLGGEEKFLNAKYIVLASNFSSLCMDFVQSVSGKEQGLEALIIRAMEDDFKSEELPARTVDGVEYRFLKLYFHFGRTPEFSPLCPYAYVVSHSVNDKSVYHYFTVEFDAMVDDGSGNGSYWLCGWSQDAKGKLWHNNYGQIKLGVETEIAEILDKLVKKKDVNSKADSSDYIPVTRIGPFAPAGWEERERVAREQREKKKKWKSLVKYFKV